MSVNKALNVSGLISEVKPDRNRGDVGASGHAFVLSGRGVLVGGFARVVQDGRHPRRRLP